MHKGCVSGLSVSLLPPSFVFPSLGQPTLVGKGGKDIGEDKVGSGGI